MSSFRRLMARLAGNEDEEAAEPVDAQRDLEIIVPPGGHKLSVEEKKRAQVSKVDEQLFMSAGSVLQSALSTFQITDQEIETYSRTKEIPGWLVDRFDGDFRKANESFLIALNARQNRREAPVVLDMATKVYAVQSRSRAAERGKAPPVNFMVMQMQAPLPVYKEVVSVPQEDDEESEDWGQ